MLEASSVLYQSLKSIVVGSNYKVQWVATKSFQQMQQQHAVRAVSDRVNTVYSEGKPMAVLAGHITFFYFRSPCVLSAVLPHNISAHTCTLHCPRVKVTGFLCCLQVTRGFSNWRMQVSFKDH